MQHLRQHKPFERIFHPISRQRVKSDSASSASSSAVRGANTQAICVDQRKHLDTKASSKKTPVSLSVPPLGLDGENCIANSSRGRGGVTSSCVLHDRLTNYPSRASPILVVNIHHSPPYILVVNIQHSHPTRYGTPGYFRRRLDHRTAVPHTTHPQLYT